MRKQLIVLSTVAAAVPMLLGILFSFLLGRSILPNPPYQIMLRMDIAALVFWLGISISSVVLGLLVLRWRVHRLVARTRVEEAYAQQASNRRFLEELDHQIKNPLQNILTIIGGLQANGTLTPEQRNSLTLIEKHTDRLNNLKEGLYGLANPGSVELSRVDLNEVLCEARDSALDTPERQDRQVVLHVSLAPQPLAPVWGDQDMLLNVFYSLIDNALKYTACDGHIQVLARANGRTAEVEVADTGRGIPQTDLPYIFEPLRRGKNARDIEGTGLGLALVKQIVDLHQGTIEVVSQEGESTQVVVRLPLAPQEAD